MQPILRILCLVVYVCCVGLEVGAQTRQLVHLDRDLEALIPGVQYARYQTDVNCEQALGIIWCESHGQQTATLQYINTLRRRRWVLELDAVGQAWFAHESGPGKEPPNPDILLKDSGPLGSRLTEQLLCAGRAIDALPDATRLVVVHAPTGSSLVAMVAWDAATESGCVVFRGSAEVHPVRCRSAYWDQLLDLVRHAPVQSGRFVAGPRGQCVWQAATNTVYVRLGGPWQGLQDQLSGTAINSFQACSTMPIERGLRGPVRNLLPANIGVNAIVDQLVLSPSGHNTPVDPLIWLLK